MMVSPPESARNQAQEEEPGLGPYSWSVLQNYERADAIKTILQKLSTILFRRDRLMLVEREEFQASTLLSPSETFSLLLHGYIGYERRGVFLKLLRFMRLRLVEDICCSVTVCCMKGDELPHCLLHPLFENGTMEAFRRWYRAFYAMRCGVFAKMQERRMMTRDRLEAMIREATVKATGEESAEVPANLEGDQFYRNYFRHLVEEHTASSDKRFESLLEYHTATKEQRVDLARIAGVVPTVIVAWMYRHPGCMTWLKDNLFNSSHLKEMKERTGLTDLRFAHLLDLDPWLSFVERYVKPLPRVKVEKPHTTALRLMPKASKRAHLVLVNLDRNREKAVEAYQSLIAYCSGWSSKEVSLIPLWSGPDGMQSEFSMMFRTPQLPFVIGTHPWSGRGSVHRPIITNIPDPEPIERVKPFEEQRLTLDMLRRASIRRAWHLLPAEERKRLCNSVAKFIEHSGAPLYFVATSDVVYSIWNPYAPTSMKSLKDDKSSKVEIRGMISTRDLLSIKDDMLQLLALEDFEFKGQVIQPSLPLEVTLDPITPRRLVVNLLRTHTCSVCLGIVAVDEMAYYRCLQCTQEKGLLCETCFGVASNHPLHHLLVRIPPLGTSEPGLNLLWGPSNVMPLHCFCDTVMTNSSGLHLDIYCNRCRSMISGIRWKCAVCYQFDLCHQCFLKATKNELHLCQQNLEQIQSGTATQRTLRHVMSTHQPLHPMICVPYARDGNNNEFLRPSVVSENLAEYLSTLDTSAGQLAAASGTTGVSALSLSTEAEVAKSVLYIIGPRRSCLPESASRIPTRVSGSREAHRGTTTKMRTFDLFTEQAVRARARMRPHSVAVRGAPYKQLLNEVRVLLCPSSTHLFLSLFFSNGVLRPPPLLPAEVLPRRCLVTSFHYSKQQAENLISSLLVIDPLVATAGHCGGMGCTESAEKKEEPRNEPTQDVDGERRGEDRSGDRDAANDSSRRSRTRRPSAAQRSVLSASSRSGAGGGGPDSRSLDVPSPRPPVPDWLRPDSEDSFQSSSSSVPQLFRMTPTNRTESGVVGTWEWWMEQVRREKITKDGISREHLQDLPNRLQCQRREDRKKR
eukprot:gene12963-8819_t